VWDPYDPVITHERAGSRHVDKSDTKNDLERYNPRSVRVRRQGLEPRTRGLRVRCSASGYYRIMPYGAVLSVTPPISLPPGTGHG
jgi:hypothetical protein